MTNSHTRPAKASYPVLPDVFKVPARRLIVKLMSLPCAADSGVGLWHATYNPNPLLPLFVPLPSFHPLMLFTLSRYLLFTFLSFIYTFSCIPYFIFSSPLTPSSHLSFSSPPLRHLQPPYPLSPPRLLSTNLARPSPNLHSIHRPRGVIGSAFDSRSKGYPFKSGRGQALLLATYEQLLFGL